MSKLVTYCRFVGSKNFVPFTLEPVLPLCLRLKQERKSNEAAVTLEGH